MDLFFLPKFLFVWGQEVLMQNKVIVFPNNMAVGLVIEQFGVERIGNYFFVSKHLPCPFY